MAVCQPAPAPSGGFWFDRKPRGAYCLPWTGDDEPARARLWQECQRFAGLEKIDR
jgi:hypothetical protein